MSLDLCYMPPGRREHNTMTGRADAIKIADRRRHRALMELLAQLAVRDLRPSATNRIVVTDGMKAALPRMLRDFSYD